MFFASRNSPLLQNFFPSAWFASSSAHMMWCSFSFVAAGTPVQVLPEQRMPYPFTRLHLKIVSMCGNLDVNLDPSYECWWQSPPTSLNTWSSTKRGYPSFTGYFSLKSVIAFSTCDLEEGRHPIFAFYLDRPGMTPTRGQRPAPFCPNHRKKAIQNFTLFIE